MVVGDASGKGVAAALMIASVQSSLRTAALFTGNDPAALVKIVNLQAYDSSLADRYATVFYGVFDRSTRMLRYVNAGHTPPVVLRRNGSIDTLETGGAPVGMFPDSSYEEGVAQLDPGDVVITYTDGVIEAANQSGDEWGVHGLLKATADWARQGPENAEHLVRSIFNSMDDFSLGCQMDDATLAVLRVL
jgi:sigma-B regulation protein RsbU (phosphoserine phosphatase)